MAQDFDKALTKWLNGELTDEAFERATSAEDLAKYKQILLEVDGWTPDLSDQVFDLESVTSKPKMAIERRLTPTVTWWAAAASLLLICTVAFLFFRSSETVYTSDASVKEILLPDGASKVFLAAGAEVRWKDDNWSDEKRILNLTGKAYFEVEKGGKFQVFTEAGDVEVLGTRFEVTSFSKLFEVVCFEGSVKMAVGKESQILKPKRAYRYMDRKWESLTIDSDRSTWLDSISTFQNAPLDQVLQTLASEYKLSINSDSINTQRRFTGSFPNNDINLALKIVFEPLDITYSLKDKTLYLN